MSKRLVGEYITSIDIGTTKICVLIAEVSPDGQVNVIGIGSYPSYGLKKGVVVNIRSTVESIKRALSAAEKDAGVCVTKAVVGIAGSHIKSFNSTGVVGISSRDVTQYDIDRVIEAAKAIPIEQDREILHVLPQHFRVDGQEFVQDSLGMYGVRLEAQVHVITGAVSSAQNIIKACELAGISVQDVVLEQLASAESVLTPSERELGVGVLDIGGGTSDFAIYKDGRVRYSKVFPVAGNHFTNDVAIGLGIPIQKAEELKCQYGVVSPRAFHALDKELLSVSLDYEGGIKKVPTRALYDILRPRADEIFELLRDEVLSNRLLAYMPAGLVVTGGGSLLQGLQHRVQSLYNVPVRIGIPQYYFSDHDQGTIPRLLQSPQYATAYGLLAFAMHGKTSNTVQGEGDAPLLSRVFRRMKSWIDDFL